MRRLPTPLLLLTLAACGGEGDSPIASQLLLARGGVPDGWTHTEEVVHDLLEAPPGWLCIREAIEPDAWQPTIWPGVRSAAIRVPGEGRARIDGGPHELLGSTGYLALIPVDQQLLDMDGIEDDSFLVVGDQLMLLDRDGSLASETLEYRGWVGRSIKRDGRVSLHGATGDGFVLLPGERLDLDLPKVGERPGAVLRFSTLCHASPSLDATTTLELLLEGELVWSEHLTNGLFGAPIPWRVELPGYHGGVLSLRVTEGHAPIVVLAPVLTSTEVLADRDRPDRPDPPDIVVFLADTFRADNLAPYGGDPRLAPVMNAFAEDALVFESAHAAAAWTLPSQASLLTSLHPHQHDARRGDLAVAPSLPTLAESLRAAGYRTVAITDGLFVSARYGLDRGFEVFLEEPLGERFDERTLDRVRRMLELDDGRPLFLFVQTYRTHVPYRATPETIAAHPELFGPDADPADWDFLELAQSPKVQAVLDPSASPGSADASAAETSAAAAEQLRRRLAALRKLYLGGVADLDRGFGDFLQLLEGRDLGAAIVVLTSDHGEAFGEHGGWGHGNSVFEEQLAVPLVLHGPGIAPGRRSAPAGLVDLAPTLVRLAGLEPDAAWTGRDLFAEPTDAPVLGFEIENTPASATSDDLAVYVGDQKVMVRLVNGELVLEPIHAFELDSDPLELRALDADSRAWATELLERHRAELEQALSARAPAVQLALTDEERGELEAMGYLGN